MSGTGRDPHPASALLREVLEAGLLRDYARTSSTNSTASPRPGGYPAVLRADNGRELACAAMANWAAQRVGLHFIPPGSRGATAALNRSTAGSVTNA